ncbi:lactosylceramide 4-alpha-galactosyltransferase-like [Penaeus japonicus]|uniref:lactosylceramide 4-alpha-galactosyltransferase-like n=1 Tax=Penaeus japonicus TaxID=27405 RepID=UPI001C7116FB|nr:lactosylceramide 4-alpha-galactosyltransferase-like [Penaeus japonicus]
MNSKFQSTKKFTKRLLFPSLILLAIFGFISQVTRQNPEEGHTEKDDWIEHLCPKYTHRDTSSELKLEWIEPTEDTIFFTETSCGKSFYGRQACVVETAARHHPGKVIQLMLTSPTIDQTDPLYQALLKLPNVKISWLDLSSLYSFEPLKTWHLNRRWLMADDRVSIFVSDSARVELLRRFGGTYLDLDVLVLRPLPAHTNYIGRVDPNQLNGAVMSFRPHHHYVTNVVNTLPKVHDPFQCCTIGPDLLTRQLHNLCPENFTLPKSTDVNALETCTDVTVYPSPAFYPIYWLPGEEHIQSVIVMGKGLGDKFMKESKAYTLHLYNSLSRKDVIYLGGDSILETIAKTYCPNVYEVLLTRHMPL